ncbi:hypothetical protein P691DRAFT_786343 [Macrolepiota fuliginosa MF-IS2]|uniref:Uncharacterized protein n=1 Tax=Macrolepiota fuliginosa MF-IS2 TaxID=1400762 RepID=A0A9P5X508_9AGAR|nr:hypothetical protein P691DRAFT_786343 [Macrolepiota fuliginosa MF-IS2]
MSSRSNGLVVNPFFAGWVPSASRVIRPRLKLRGALEGEGAMLKLSIFSDVSEEFDVDDSARAKMTALWGKITEDNSERPIFAFRFPPIGKNTPRDDRPSQDVRMSKINLRQPPASHLGTTRLGPVLDLVIKAILASDPASTEFLDYRTNGHVQGRLNTRWVNNAERVCDKLEGWVGQAEIQEFGTEIYKNVHPRKYSIEVFLRLVGWTCAQYRVNQAQGQTEFSSGEDT